MTEIPIESFKILTENPNSKGICDRKMSIKILLVEIVFVTNISDEFHIPSKKFQIDILTAFHQKTLWLTSDRVASVRTFSDGYYDRTFQSEKILTKEFVWLSNELMLFDEFCDRNVGWKRIFGLVHLRLFLTGSIRILALSVENSDGKSVAIVES